MIDGRTRLVGLIGWPVGHSLSPRMHNAAFDKLGLDWCCVPLPVAPERLGEAVKGLVALGFAGANVTAPHKEAVMAHLDEITPEVQAIGAVNTIVLREGRTIGYNTDWYGFLAALQENGFAPQGRRAVVLGAGGAARAVVYALAGAGSEVVVFNRTQERAKALVEALSLSFPAVSLSAIPLTMEALIQRATEADLLVNATSVGTWPEVDQCPWPEDVAFPSHLTVFDLVYSPPQTKLLESAASVGASTVGGLGMLVHQGAGAFQLWTGLEPPVEAMYEACCRPLGGERCCAF
jgi:shikimate dehydrogenase